MKKSKKEKYTLTEALKGCTSEVSYLFNMEDKIGTLEEGKLADVIIILTENIFEINLLNIEDVKVKTTIFNGEIVYEI